MKSENLNIAFIPQYCSELAPIENYFSKLMQKVTKRTIYKNVDWKSMQSSQLLAEIYKRFLLIWSRKYGHHFQTKFVIKKTLDSYS